MKDQNKFIKIKHTKGEWQVSHSPLNVTDESMRFNPLMPVYYKNVKDQKSIGGRIIAKCLGKIPEDVEANAKLIAASPELLKAVEGLFSLLENNYLVRNIENDHNRSFFIKQGIEITVKLSNAKKAIKKATK